MTEFGKHFIGTVPDYYDRCLGPVIFAEPARRMAGHVAALAPSRVLETAAGTGIVTREVMNRVASIKHYVATDLSTGMLEVLSAKMQDRPGLIVEPVDAVALPYGDQAFDAVISQFGVMFFPDKAEAFRQARRVLKPGGHFLFSVWDRVERNSFSQVIRQQALAMSVVPSFQDVPFGYNSVDTIRHALDEAGFGSVRVDIVRTRSAIADPAQFAEGAVYGSPLGEQVRSQGGDLAELHRSVSAAFTRELGNETQLQYLIFDAVVD